MSYKLHVVIHSYSGDIKTDIIEFAYQQDAVVAYKALIASADKIGAFSPYPANMTVTKLF